MEDGGTTGMRLTEGPKFHQDLRMKEWKTMEDDSVAGIGGEWIISYCCPRGQ